MNTVTHPVGRNLTSLSKRNRAKQQIYWEGLGNTTGKTINVKHKHSRICGQPLFNPFELLKRWRGEPLGSWSSCFLSGKTPGGKGIMRTSVEKFESRKTINSGKYNISSKCPVTLGVGRSRTLSSGG